MTQVLLATSKAHSGPRQSCGGKKFVGVSVRETFFPGHAKLEFEPKGTSFCYEIRASEGKTKRLIIVISRI